MWFVWLVWAWRMVCVYARGRTSSSQVRSRAYDDPCIDDDFTLLSDKCASAIVVNGESTSIKTRGHTVMYVRALYAPELYERVHAKRQKLK